MAMGRRDGLPPSLVSDDAGEGDAARDVARDEADSSAIGDFLRQVARADPYDPAGAAIPDPLLGAVIDGKYRIDRSSVGGEWGRSMRRPTWGLVAPSR